MANIKELQLDRNIYIDGRWITYPSDEGEPFRFKVAMKFNPRYQEVNEKEFMTDEELKSLSIKQRRERLARIYAESILLGWENLTDGEGNEIPYSKEKCIEILADPTFAPLLAIVETESVRLKEFQEKRIEQVGKSLDNTSNND